jgi:hypothetical protein
MRWRFEPRGVKHLVVEKWFLREVVSSASALFNVVKPCGRGQSLLPTVALGLLREDARLDVINRAILNRR